MSASVPASLPSAVPPLAPPRLTARGIAAMGVLYVVFGALYASTLAWAPGGFEGARLGADLRRTLLLDFPLKALWTLPVWWLFFKTQLDRAGWLVRLLAHIVVAPLWVGAWFASYYGLLTGLPWPALPLALRKWDVYVPLLFYGVQFGVMHMVRHTQQLRHRSALEQELRTRAHVAELAALRAQLDPHFLFNALNSISASVPPAEEATRSLIARLAQTIRFALDASRRDLVPLRAELDFLRAYLDLEQARFGADRLRVVFEVPTDEASRARPVPPMLIQPLVENAVRHGVGPRVGGGTLTVEVRSQPHSLLVRVTDTGQGLKPGTDPATLLHPRPTAGVGLPNTHARLRGLGATGLHVESLATGGLSIWFELPLAPKDYP